MQTPQVPQALKSVVGVTLTAGVHQYTGGETAIPYTVSGYAGKSVILWLCGTDGTSWKLPSSAPLEAALIVPHFANLLKTTKGKAWKARPPGWLQVFAAAVQCECEARGLLFTVMGFSRGAFWASHFALHVKMDRLVLVGWYPEPGEEDHRIVSNGAALEPQVLMVQSPIDQLCSFSKAKLFEQGLRQKPHNQFVEVSVTHERLFNIMQIDDRCAENYNHLGHYILMFATQVAPEKVEA